MPPVRHPRLSLEQWDSYKDTIRHLYLNENMSLEGKDGVIERMANRHNLRASKAQYETQFKRWDFRKNLTKEAWHSIWHILETRGVEGRTSHVYFLGEKLKDEKVKKETSRYRACTLHEVSCSTNKLPGGVEIRDAQAFEDGSAAVMRRTVNQQPELLQPTPEVMELTTTTSEGEISRTRSFSSRIEEDLSDPIHLPTFDLLNNQSLDIMNCFLEPGLEQSWLSGTLNRFGGHFGLDPANSTQQDVRITTDLPTLAYPIPENTTALLDSSGALVLNASRAEYRDAVPAIKACISQTMSLLPCQTRNELQTLAPDAILLKLILFLLMNNFASDDHPAFTTLFEQIKHFSSSQIEYVLEAFPHPYSLALQQSIFILGIKANFPPIVELLTSRGLQATQLGRTTGSTPLRLACSLRHPRMVEILLRSNMDFDQELGYGSGIVEELLESIEKTHLKNESNRILQLLLVAGAKVSFEDLSRSCLWKNESILDVYVKYVQSPALFENDSYIGNALANMMRVRDFERATSVVRTMLGEDFGSRFKSETTLDACQFALQKASLQGNSSLVDFFLENRITPDAYCLCDALRGDNEQIALRYIQLGVDVTEPCVIRFEHSYGENYYLRRYAGVLSKDMEPFLRDNLCMNPKFTSPYAEAIRWNRPMFLHMFTRMGVMDAITDERRTQAVIAAAAEVGDGELVQRFLTRQESPRDQLSSSLGIAVLGNHDELVVSMMASGVKPNASCIVAAVVVRNRLLLRLFLDVPMEADGLSVALYFAVRWGDIEIVRNLIRLGISLHESGWITRYWRFEGIQSDDNFSPLLESIIVGNLEVTRILLESGANMNSNRCPSALSVAVQNANEDFVHELLSRGADPNDPSALKAAVLRSKDMAEIILEAFHQRYPKGHRGFACYALREAIRSEDESTVSLLVAHTDLNQLEVPGLERSLSLLGEAISSRHIDIIRTLLDCGVDPNGTVSIGGRTTEQERRTAILEAITTDDIAVVRLLREAGANLNEPAEFGIRRTALQLSVEKGKPEIIQYLLENGAEVNAAPCMWGGATALQLAAIKGNVGLAEQLITEYNADVNAPASRFEGRTAFEGAAEYGRLDMLLALYRHNVDIISDGGKQVQRAMEFAEKNGQLAAKALVEQLAEYANTNAIPGPDFLSQFPSMYDF